MSDTSLAAHTPSPAYIQASVRQRALELLGANASLSRRLAPTPYESDYPPSRKLRDAIIAIAIDPITKPMSLRGDLERSAVLHKLANELADRGYLRRYSGGGIGIGGGGEGGGGAGPGTGGPGDVGGGTGGVGGSGTASTGATGTGGPAGTGGVSGAAGEPGLGGWSSLSALATLLGLVPGAQPASLMLGLMGLGGRLGLFGPFGQGPAPSFGPSPTGQAGGAFDVLSMMRSSAPGSSAVAPAPSPTISATTRANAAARLGGGISPNFLDALQSLDQLRTQAG